MIALLGSLDHYLPNIISLVMSVWIIRHLPSDQDVIQQYNIVLFHIHYIGVNDSCFVGVYVYQSNQSKYDNTPWSNLRNARFVIEILTCWTDHITVGRSQMLTSEWRHNSKMNWNHCLPNARMKVCTELGLRRILALGLRWFQETFSRKFSTVDWKWVQQCWWLLRMCATYQLWTFLISYFVF